MSANTAYRGSPLEAFVADISARSGLQQVLGDYEGARMSSQRPPVFWRHPSDRYILEVGPVTDHRAEIDPFAEVKETLELIVCGADYPRALADLVNIWRCFEMPAIERDEVNYLIGVEYGKTRRPREREPLPAGVPSSTFTLIDLVSITWLAPRQEPAYATIESVKVFGKLFEGGLLVDTTEAPTS